MAINGEHFLRLDDPEKQKNLFKLSVRAVEIEVSSYCNRKCWFCPNSKIDRRTAKNFMDEGVYLRILSELASIDYDGWISYSGYAEAMADRSFITRVRQARAALPRAWIMTCSNGDYLTPEYLEDLADAGINELYVSAYVDDHQPNWTDDRALTALSRFVFRMGLTPNFETVQPGSQYQVKLNHARVTLIVGSRNHLIHANDRGNTVDINRPMRTSPCTWVFSNVYIDWDGTVVPCCNVRSDVPEHKDYLIANLSSGATIFEAYANSSAVEWRRSMARFGPKANPCTNCYQGSIPDTPQNRQVFAVVEDFVKKHEAIEAAVAASKEEERQKAVGG